MRSIALTLLLLGSTPAEKPNIVVILCDDLGIGDPGCYNPESRIPTPNLDRLAAGGMRFRDMHTPSSVCTPTRYGLLTGRYCWRTSLKKGVLWGFSPALLEPGRATMASVLKARGYRTAIFGKWHLGLGSAAKTDYAQPLDPGPLSAGFDEFEGIPASLDMEPYVWVKGKGVEAQPSDNIPASKHQREGGEGFWRGGPIAPGLKHVDILPRVEKATLDFLGRQTASTPFFLYVPLTSPHTPWLPTPDWAGKSKIGAYGDFVMQTDAVVGRVLDALPKNTLVIVTSDNGSHWPAEDIKKWGHRANGPWRGQKADIHEGGHRVPFLASWPGSIAPGTTSDVPACLTDLFATVAEIAGDPATAEDSHSLLPALKGEGRTSRTHVVHHSSNGMFAIREGSWKLIQGQGSGGFTKVKVEPGEPPGQLYDLASDPGETKNLYAEKPEVVARLSALLR
jgi:arylsulfatase A-like enzyme